MVGLCCAFIVVWLGVVAYRMAMSLRSLRIGNRAARRHGSDDASSGGGSLRRQSRKTSTTSASNSQRPNSQAPNVAVGNFTDDRPDDDTPASEGASDPKPARRPSRDSETQAGTAATSTVTSAISLKATAAASAGAATITTTVNAPTQLLSESHSNGRPPTLIVATTSRHAGTDVTGGLPMNAVVETPNPMIPLDGRADHAAAHFVGGQLEDDPLPGQRSRRGLAANQTSGRGLTRGLSNFKWNVPVTPSPTSSPQPRQSANVSRSIIAGAVATAVSILTARKTVADGRTTLNNESRTGSAASESSPAGPASELQVMISNPMVVLGPQAGSSSSPGLARAPFVPNRSRRRDVSRNSPRISTTGSAGITKSLGSYFKISSPSQSTATGSGTGSSSRTGSPAAPAQGTGTAIPARSQAGSIASGTLDGSAVSSLRDPVDPPPSLRDSDDRQGVKLDSHCGTDLDPELGLPGSHARAGLDSNVHSLEHDDSGSQLEGNPIPSRQDSDGHGAT